MFPEMIIPQTWDFINSGLFFERSREITLFYIKISSRLGSKNNF